MHLTSEAMDEYTQLWHDESSAPDAQDERGAGIVVAVVLIENGDLRVDPLELF
jgi:hypothetical protein